MSNKTQPKKQASEYEREKKQASAEVKPITFSGEASNLWKGILKSTSNDLIGGSLGSISEQILGPSTGGQQLHEGQAVSLKKSTEASEKQEKKPAVTAEHMEYFRGVNNVDRIGETRTEQQVRSAVDQIRMEIQKLMKTSRLVERTVKDATADQTPIKPGKYHLNFFEFVLGVIKDATRKLEDTVSYGAVFQSKKQQSKYWNSVKSNGTSFQLSGERTVSTQTG
jgi:hypothetical protein